MNNIKGLPPFKRLCVTIGNLPSSYVDSMSYYECLMWLCNYLKNTVVPAVNENAEAVNELINWFNNLDVQDEIDHKLDEMVESGELQEIISEYLNSQAVFGYDKVSDMTSATNLINGSYARTCGKISFNDGYGALYKIRTITNQDVVDGDDIIAMNDETLVAEKIKNIIKDYRSNKLNYMLKNNQSPKLSFVGDSITYGYGSTGDSFPEMIKDWIDDRYNTDITIYNHGVNGDVSSSSITNFNTYKAENPDIIFWEYGINDSNTNVPVKTTCDNLVKFYNLCVKNNIELVVILPTPTNKTDELYKTNTLMKELYLSLKTTCESLGIIYIDMFEVVNNLYESNGGFIKQLQPDGTHFTDYSIFRDNILAKLLSSIYTVENTSLLSPAIKNDFIDTNGTVTDYNSVFSNGCMMYFSDITNAKYKLTFYNKKPIRIKVFGYLRSNSCKITYKVDNNSFEVNEHNTSNSTATDSAYNTYFDYNPVILPGLHTFELDHITKVEETDSTAYYGGILFTEVYNLNTVNYASSILYSGNIQNGTNVALTNGTFNRCQKIMLDFEKNNYHQIIYVPVLRVPNLTTYTQSFILQDGGNIVACNITLDLSSHTFTLVNTTSYNLKHIFVDYGNNNSPFNF